MEIGKIFISGEIGVDVTLLDVIKQVKAQSSATEFVVKIDSIGGFVDTGMDIYNYLRNLKKPITTITSKAYSIASVIYMAGDVRIIPEGAENAVMIHLPWMEVVGDSATIDFHNSDLKNVENDLIKFYSKNLDIDTDTIHSLLKNDTYLSANEALEIGIATQLQKPQLAVAKLHNNENKEDQTLMNKLNKKIDQIMNLLSGKIKAELKLQDATGVEIVFPELADGDSPEVDDKATVDGADANGEFLLPDGQTMVFETGSLKEIKPVEDAPAEESAPTEAKAEIIKELIKFEIDVNNTSFEIGETLKYTYEDVEYSVSAGEYELSDGRKIIADADGKIVEVKDAVAPTTIEEPAPSEDVNAMLNIIEEMAKKTAEIEAKYTALAKQVGSDFSTENKGENSTIKASEGVGSFSIKRK